MAGDNSTVPLDQIGQIKQAAARSGPRNTREARTKQGRCIRDRQAQERTRLGEHLSVGSKEEARGN